MVWLTALLVVRVKTLKVLGTRTVREYVEGFTDKINLIGYCNLIITPQ